MSPSLTEGSSIEMFAAFAEAGTARASTVAAHARAPPANPRPVRHIEPPHAASVRAGRQMGTVGLRPGACKLGFDIVGSELEQGSARKAAWEERMKGRYGLGIRHGGART